MKRKKEEVDEQNQEELQEGVDPKKRKRESVEKRKHAKKMDKVERWSGMILLGMILLIGFLLWVAGEMKF
ncbi:MAG: hypothetical protein ACD_40C00028G0001 [uncultured bacterium]|jgi:hypothetical protein|uniref:Uncharacterized protein n=2 Tax=Candidatus Collieribacteriota TaxID=1752725 RepID=A0A1F5FXP2_9BACT|nr:MAG: hypothetical protein ACD_40C00028G0001 [uncultured bacterium]KKU21188.1 MAG: hypothetical protein UX32_C0006G0048 [Microgenomates group bacterium GW2011_GWF1_46_12]KKU27103.1 MAG: hypothetical protein UX38_C0001G0103 [Microgenomates group bacterium GW2011_GWC1_46_16]KKU27855.1 MAG: hypothetical protein UX40_C0005G0008 [Microgenomates group bacterium GW2011_GWF2_46_18]KKU42985.1 MAG: hypothetical protein UX59_C0034G0002 [Microgenomates group bacterium GW2011_GWA1_46_7]KKU45073.1 MAG: hy